MVRIRSWTQRLTGLYADGAHPLHPAAPDPGAAGSGATLDGMLYAPVLLERMGETGRARALRVRGLGERASGCRGIRGPLRYRAIA